MTQNQEVNPEPSSNEETRAISLSSELAEWVKLLRAQWMEPVNSGWGQGKRFLMALAGSVTFFVIVIPALKENLPLFVVTEPSYCRRSSFIFPYSSHGSEVGRMVDIPQ